MPEVFEDDDWVICVIVEVGQGPCLHKMVSQGLQGMLLVAVQLDMTPKVVACCTAHQAAWNASILGASTMPGLNLR